MPEISRRKALAIEVAAMTGWVTLPQVTALFPHQVAFYFDPTRPLPNVQAALGYLAILLPILFVMWASGDRMRDFGWDRFRARRDPLWIVGLSLGGFLLYTAILPMIATAPGARPSGIAVALSIVLAASLSAMWEELFFRGYLISRLEELTGRTWLAVVTSSALSALGYFSQGSWGAAAAFVYGLVLGGAFVVRRSIWPLVVAVAALTVALNYVDRPTLWLLNRG